MHKVNCTTVIMKWVSLSLHSILCQNLWNFFAKFQGSVERCVRNTSPDGLRKFFIMYFKRTRGKAVLSQLRQIYCWRRNNGHTLLHCHHTFSWREGTFLHRSTEYVNVRALPSRIQRLIVGWKSIDVSEERQRTFSGLWPRRQNTSPSPLWEPKILTN
jgi:hypothetical protein